MLSTEGTQVDPIVVAETSPVHPPFADKVEKLVVLGEENEPFKRCYNCEDEQGVIYAGSDRSHSECADCLFMGVSTLQCSFCQKPIALLLQGIALDHSQSHVLCLECPSTMLTFVATEIEASAKRKCESTIKCNAERSAKILKMTGTSKAM